MKKITKSMIFLVVVTTACDTLSLFGQAKIHKEKISGRIVAYSRIADGIPPNGYVPRIDELIVKAEDKSGKTPVFIRLVNEYFSKETTLPDDIFSNRVVWDFTVVRRVDCDGAVSPVLP